jgi:hypothetical protein
MVTRSTFISGIATTRLGLGLIAWLGVLASTARADLLYFKNGGEIQAPAATQGELVVVELPEGRQVFHRTDFRKRVPGFDPESEAAERLRKARSSGPTARHAAVWWAIENGLIDLAVTELRELRRADPDDAPTARMAAVLDHLAHSCNDPETGPFLRALGVPVEAARGPHVLLLHQRDEAEARARVALLEKVTTAYFLFFAAQGIELEPPRRRVVFAWLNEQEDYLTFLRAQDAAVFATTRGYFHPTWNAVIAYDARSTERQRNGRETAAARRAELSRFQETLDRMPTGAKLRVTLTGQAARTLSKLDASALRERLERDVVRDEVLLDLERRAIDEGTAAHEIIHLLAANSGLHPRHDAFPRWLQEGLAMQFELIRGGRWAGISRVHDLRLPDWRKFQPPQLEPLVRDEGMSRGYQRDAYAQTWSLVYFLRTRHPAEFLTFLDVLRGPDTSLSELAPADRFLAAFRRAFGSDLESLERDWHAFMATVKTPLELHAPAEPAPASPSLRQPSQRRSQPPAPGRFPAS